jgi:hypothetical protein
VPALSRSFTEGWRLRILAKPCLRATITPLGFSLTFLPVSYQSDPIKSELIYVFSM